MRGIRVWSILMMVSLVLAPLAAAAGQASPPSDKAGVQAAAPPGAQQVKPAARQEAKPAAKPPAKKGEEKRTEEIVPAYSDIKQRSAVIVFYVWLWLSIAVLAYFLRLWIKEADRVYKAKYYEPEESPRKGNPMAAGVGE